MKKNIVYSLIIAVLVITSLCTLVACNKDDPKTQNNMGFSCDPNIGYTPTFPSVKPANPESIIIATPDGAPAIALAGIMKNGLNIEGTTATIKIVLPTQIGAQVAGEKADFAIIPSNAAYNLYLKALEKNSKEKYLMVGTATYGNLFIVGGETSSIVTNIEQLKGKIIYSIGEKAVPEFVIKAILKENFNKITNETEVNNEKINILFLQDGPSVIGKLKKDTNAYGLLGEPAVTASKGKANTKVLFDLQDLYKDATNSNIKGYPQAILVCKKSLIDSNPQFVIDVYKQIKASANFANNNTTEVPGIIESNGGTKFPPKAIAGSNVLVKSAKDAKVNTAKFIYNTGVTKLVDDFYFFFNE